VPRTSQSEAKPVRLRKSPMMSRPALLKAEMAWKSPTRGMSGVLAAAQERQRKDGEATQLRRRP